MGSRRRSRRNDGGDGICRRRGDGDWYGVRERIFSPERDHQRVDVGDAGCGRGGGVDDTVVFLENVWRQKGGSAGTGSDDIELWNAVNIEMLTLRDIVRFVRN